MSLESSSWVQDMSDQCEGQWTPRKSDRAIRSACHEAAATDANRKVIVTRMKFRLSARTASKCTGRINRTAALAQRQFDKVLTMILKMNIQDGAADSRRDHPKADRTERDAEHKA